MGGVVSAGRNNEELINNLVNAGIIKSPCVEKAFKLIDRGEFFLPKFSDLSYKDQPWKEGLIHLSAPCIYAEALEALELERGHSFLNIGSGSGYLNSLAGCLLGDTGRNDGVEVHEEAIEHARNVMSSLDLLDSVEFCYPNFMHHNILSIITPSTRDRPIHTQRLYRNRISSYVSNYENDDDDFNDDDDDDDEDVDKFMRIFINSTKSCSSNDTTQSTANDIDFTPNSTPNNSKANAINDKFDQNNNECVNVDKKDEEEEEEDVLLYDRVYCGAGCTDEHEDIIKSFVKIGGILVYPLNDQLVQAKRLSKNNWLTRSLLSVSFAELQPITKDDVVKELECPKVKSLKHSCRLMIRRCLRQRILEEVQWRPIKLMTARNIWGHENKIKEDGSNTESTSKKGNMKNNNKNKKNNRKKYKNNTKYDKNNNNKCEYDEEDDVYEYFYYECPKDFRNGLSHGSDNGSKKACTDTNDNSLNCSSSSGDIGNNSSIVCGISSNGDSSNFASCSSSYDASCSNIISINTGNCNGKTDKSKIQAIRLRQLYDDIKYYIMNRRVRKNFNNKRSNNCLFEDEDYEDDNFNNNFNNCDGSDDEDDVMGMFRFLRGNLAFKVYNNSDTPHSDDEEEDEEKDGKNKIDNNNDKNKNNKKNKNDNGNGKNNSNDKNSIDDNKNSIKKAKWDRIVSEMMAEEGDEDDSDSDSFKRKNAKNVFNNKFNVVQNSSMFPLFSSSWSSLSTSSSSSSSSFFFSSSPCSLSSSLSPSSSSLSASPCSSISSSSSTQLDKKVYNHINEYLIESYDKSKNINLATEPINVCNAADATLLLEQKDSCLNGHSTKTCLNNKAKCFKLNTKTINKLSIKEPADKTDDKNHINNDNNPHCYTNNNKANNRHDKSDDSTKENKDDDYNLNTSTTTFDEEELGEVQVLNEDVAVLKMLKGNNNKNNNDKNYNRSNIINNNNNDNKAKNNDDDKNDLFKKERLWAFKGRMIKNIGELCLPPAINKYLMFYKDYVEEI